MYQIIKNKKILTIYPPSIIALLKYPICRKIRIPISVHRFFLRKRECFCFQFQTTQAMSRIEHFFSLFGLAFCSYNTLRSVNSVAVQQPNQVTGGISLAYEPRIAPLATVRTILHKALAYCVSVRVRCIMP